MPNVLFVCKANLIRSPLAAAMLRKLLTGNGMNDSGWVIDSAGVWARYGASSPEKALAIAGQYDVDLSSHTAKEIDNALIDAADLVVCMEAGQREALQHEFPEAATRIWSLAQLSGPEYDVPDPAGRSTGTFQTTAKLIHDLLESGFEWLTRLAVENEQRKGA